MAQFTGSTPNSAIIPKIVWTSEQNVNGNYSIVTASLYYSRTDGYSTWGNLEGSITINGNKKTFSPYVEIKGTDVFIASHTVNVSHNSDGAKSITISATGLITETSLSSTTISKTVNLPTIARASEYSVSGKTLGSKQTITVAKKNSSYTHTITWKCGDKSGTVCTKSASTSVEWTPAISLATENTKGTSVTLALSLQTYNGTAKIGSAVTSNVTMAIPSSVKPTLTATFSDTSGADAITGSIVKGISSVRIVASPSGIYDSTISKTVITYQGKEYNQTDVTALVTSSGNAVIKTTDSRGRSASVTISIPAIDYTKPKITRLDVHRCDASGAELMTGDYARIDFDGTVDNGITGNAGSWSLSIGTSSDTMQEIANPTSGMVISADSASSYIITAKLSDKLANVSKTIPLSTGKCYIHIAQNGAMGLNKVCELDDANALEVGYNLTLFEELKVKTTDGIRTVPIFLGSVLARVDSATGINVGVVTTMPDTDVTLPAGTKTAFLVGGAYKYANPCEYSITKKEGNTWTIKTKAVNVSNATNQLTLYYRVMCYK